MSFVTVATTDELTDDLPLAVDAGEFDVAIVRHGDDWFAIKDECSHANVPLSEGDVEVGPQGCTIECYLHGSQFSLATGAALNLPATQPVPVYPVRIVGDDVQIDIDNPINSQDFQNSKEN